jgi:hypothetical protein
MESTTDRSYKVQNDLPVGSIAVTLDDTYWKGDIPANTVCRVVCYSNAGFRGILASVKLIDMETGEETRHAHFSAGLLDRY